MMIYALICRVGWLAGRARGKIVDTRTPRHVAFARPWPTTRRGFKLWVVAVTILARGVVYALGIIPSVTESGLRLLTVDLGTPMWLISWSAIIVAGFCMWTGYCHLGRDRLGFGVLMAYCTAWTCTNLCALAVDAPTTVLLGALTWAAPLLFLAASAGDPPPERLTCHA